MKKLFSVILIGLFLFLGCSKEEPKETFEEILPDVSFIKFLNYPSTSTPMHQYSTMTFHISYHISTNFLTYSGFGFKMLNLIRVDNGSSKQIWSSERLRFRTDTLDFKFQTYPYPPDNKIVFFSEIVQMTDEKGGYVIIESDSLEYNIIK